MTFKTVYRENSYLKVFKIYELLILIPLSIKLDYTFVLVYVYTYVSSYIYTNLIIL